MRYDSLWSGFVGCVIGASVVTVAWASSETRKSTVCHETTVVAALPNKAPMPPTVAKPVTPPPTVKAPDAPQAGPSVPKMAVEKYPSPLFHVEFIPSKAAATWSSPIPKKYYAESHHRHQRQHQHHTHRRATHNSKYHAHHHVHRHHGCGP